RPSRRSHRLPREGDLGLLPWAPRSPPTAPSRHGGVRAVGGRSKRVHHTARSRLRSSRVRRLPGGGTSASPIAGRSGEDGASHQHSSSETESRLGAHGTRPTRRSSSSRTRIGERLARAGSASRGRDRSNVPREDLVQERRLPRGGGGSAAGGEPARRGSGESSHGARRARPSTPRPERQHGEAGRSTGPRANRDGS